MEDQAEPNQVKRYTLTPSHEEGSSRPRWIHIMFWRAVEWLSRSSTPKIIIIIAMAAFIPPVTLLFTEWGIVMKAWAYAISFAIALSAFMLPLLAMMTGFKRKIILRLSGSMQAMRSLVWQDFEELFAAYFIAVDYEVERRGGAQGDGGIDLIVRKNKKRFIVQCKHWREEAIPVHPIRELYGIMVRKKYDGAFFVISGVFTNIAEEEFDEDPKMTLINGNELLSRILRVHDMKNIVLGQDPDDTFLEKFINKIEEFQPENQLTLNIARCKNCDRRMLIRRKGDSIFWACPEWKKKCRDGETRRINNYDQQIIHSLQIK